MFTLLSFLGKGKSLRLGVPPYRWAVLAWGVERCRQNELFFLPFLCGSSEDFCFLVLLKLFKWTPELPELFLSMNSCLIVVVCMDMEAGVSSSTILVGSSPSPLKNVTRNSCLSVFIYAKYERPRLVHSSRNDFCYLFPSILEHP